jgi:hypothetical protein
MPARAVRSPVPVTSTRRDPEPFTVPATTSESVSFSTGLDSPVSMDSFTALRPSRTTPSAGIDAPGRTSTNSPSRSSETGTSSVPPSVTRTAMSGRSFANSLSAPWACPMERISIQCPRTMIVTRVASSHHRGCPPQPKVTARL